MKVIQVNSLSFSYSKDNKKALDNISFSVEKGESIGIIGRTGSGKSTLIRHLNGLLTSADGSVLIMGNMIKHSKKSVSDLCFDVGMVFQYPEDQLFAETVYEDIAFGAKNMGKSKEQIDDLMDEVLHDCCIERDLLQKSPFELSGGQQRRVSLAGVLIMKTPILVLDEPTASLDNSSAEHIFSVIEAHKKKNGTTLIIVSHDMEIIANYTDKVLILDSGKQVAFDTTQKIMSDTNLLKKHNLKPAQSVIMQNLLEEEGMKFSSKSITLDGLVEQIVQSINS